METSSLYVTVTVNVRLYCFIAHGFLALLLKNLSCVVSILKLKSAYLL
jgi:hypothetical protein